jgi:hypothetical protein
MLYTRRMLEVLSNPQQFFETLRNQSKGVFLPLSVILLVFVVSNTVPAALGALQQQNLLASLIIGGIFLASLIGFSALLTPRAIEIIGYSFLPLLIGMVLFLPLALLGAIGQNIGAGLVLGALVLTLQRAFIGARTLSGSSGAAWRAILIAPIAALLFTGLVPGLLFRWLGLA